MQSKQWLIIIACLCASVCACAANGAPRSTTFARAVLHARENDLTEARSLLDQLRDGEAVAQGIEYVNANPDMDDRSLQFCLSELAHRGAGKTQAGFELFTRAVKDPATRDVAILGLADAPPNRRAEAVALLLSVLGKDTTDANRASVVNVLENWGPDAKLARPVIAQIFHDGRQNHRTRSIAAQALLTIGPVDEAIKMFGSDDRSVVLGPLAFVGSKSAGQFDGKAETKEQVRAYVRKAMESEDRDTRELALFALGPVYGLDLVAGSREEGYHVNQEVLDALGNMATSDPDEVLRARAQRMLDTKDKRLRRLIKRLESSTSDTKRHD